MIKRGATLTPLTAEPQQTVKFIVKERKAWRSFEVQLLSNGRLLVITSKPMAIHPASQHSLQLEIPK